MFSKHLAKVFWSLLIAAVFTGYATTLVRLAHSIV